MMNQVYKAPYDSNSISELTIHILFHENPGHCYAFIYDDTMYEDILTKRLFNVISEKSVFIIKITPQEDLLSPDYQTVKTLIEIKKAGCKFYAIFLNNGTRAGRLLRFGHKHRVVDTRAKYLMFYDLQLFKQNLHYIWKRIINVVFIRKYNNKISNNGENVFELTTVPYPLPLHQTFVTKRLDFWRGGKYRFGTNLYRDKTSNLLGKNLNVVVLPHVPGIFKNHQNNISIEYSGLEIEIMKSLSTAMNFTYDLYEAKDSLNEKWGRKLGNGTLTGLLGEITDDYADFAIADLHYTQFHLELMDLSIPYSTHCLTFLTPEAATDNSWKTLILPFNEGMWCGVFITLICVGFVFYGLAKFHKDLQHKRNIIQVIETHKCLKNKGITLKSKRVKITKDIFDEITGCIMYTYSMLLVVSLPRLPRSWTIRLLTGWYLIYCLLVAVSYRSSMTAILANPSPK